MTDLENLINYYLSGGDTTDDNCDYIYQLEDEFIWEPIFERITNGTNDLDDTIMLQLNSKYGVEVDALELNGYSVYGQVQLIELTQEQKNKITQSLLRMQNCSSDNDY